MSSRSAPVKSLPKLSRSLRGLRNVLFEGEGRCRRGNCAVARTRRRDFKRRGGVLAIPREMIRSPAYRRLSLPARCLIVELQDVWRPDVTSIHYSVRRVAARLGVSKDTASRAFAELETLGFVRLAEESNWYSGKARNWALTWMPNSGREPWDDWKARPENSLKSAGKDG